MPKYITENEFTNRKVKFQSIATAITTFLSTATPLIAIINPDIAQSLDTSMETLRVIALAIGAGLAGVVTLVGYLFGYFTHPAEGDGIKKA